MPMRFILPLAVLLSTSLIFSSSCVRGGGDISPDSVKWELSPQARLNYAILLLDQSIRNDSLIGVLDASEIFMEISPQPRPLAEAAAWLLLNKELDAARTLLERAVVKLPRDLSLHMLLAEVWLEKGDPAKAVGIVEAFQKAWPDSDQARQELAILLLKSGRAAEAEAMFAALPQRLRTAYVRYCHARALLLLRRPAEAVKQLDEAVRQSPEFVEAWSELARAHELAGQPAKARAVYARLMEVEPDNADFRLRAVELELADNNPARALTLTRSGPESQGFMLSAASMFLERKQFKEAESVLDSLTFYPDAPDDVWLLRAVIAHEARRNTAEALSWLDRITPGSASLNRAYRFRVQILYTTGDDAGVREALREAMSIFPEDPEFPLMEAQFFIARDDMRQAERLLEELIRRFPSDPDALFSYGTVLDSLNRKKDALGIMEKVIALDNTHYQALNYIGYSIADNAGKDASVSSEQLTRDLARAVELLHRAVALAPGKAHIMDSLAWAQFRAGDLKNAWESIRTAVTLSGSDEAEIWEHYGDIARAVSNTAEARKGWKKALQLQSATPDRIERKLRGEE